MVTSGARGKLLPSSDQEVPTRPDSIGQADQRRNSCAARKSHCGNVTLAGAACGAQTLALVSQVVPSAQAGLLELHVLSGPVGPSWKTSDWRPPMTLGNRTS